ncbi:MAG: L,D-transpeptidase [Lachnospiraceae bacterium]|nr:L,D-transpeptidase [Lachnospiraceae bacterium]
MSKKGFVLGFVGTCVMLTGCNLQKTDTSELRALGINHINVQQKELNEALGSAGNMLLLSSNREVKSLAVEDIKLSVKSDAKKDIKETEKQNTDSKNKINDRSSEPAVTETNEPESEEKEWDRLAPTTHMSFEELVGDNGVYEYPSAFDKPDTYKIIVDLKYQVVMVYSKDRKGDYTVPVRYMLCSTGADKTKSPVGTFEMKDYRVRFSRFVNTENYGQYWSLITGKIYFHSILYDSRNASDYITSTWNNLGKNVSHGCIRLSVPDARFIYYNMAPGTIVQIRNGSSSDTDTKLIREKLLEGKAKAPSERAALIAGDIPDTDNWDKNDIPQVIPFVQGHQ